MATRALLVLTACGICVGLIATAGKLAAEPDRYPSFGSVVNDQNKDFLHFACSPNSETSIVCSFSQVRIHSNGSSAADLDKEMKEIPRTLKAFKGDKKQCPPITKLAAAMRSGPPFNIPESKDFLDKWSTSSEPEHSDVLKDIESIEKVCLAPTNENVVAMIKWQNARNSRTCSLSVNSYEETFDQRGTGLWVHNGTPDGLCGVISISTLESDDKGIIWKYRVRRVVTDKNALKDNAIFDCKNIDEGEYVYAPQTSPFYKGCDYIKNGF
jgi:hypothetical protein